MKYHFAMGVLVVLTAVAAFSPDATAQTRFDTFDNGLTACSLVNGVSNEFVVLTETNPRLMRVTGSDLILDDTLVDANSFVFVRGVQLGLIDFALDGDGNESLWWLTFDNFVIDLDGLTGEPFVTNAIPSEFFSVPCDACELVDNPAFSECSTIDLSSIVLCGNGLTPAMLMTMGVGLMGLRFSRHT